MMNTIVTYKSNTGFTKKYAEWIAEALSCEAIPVERAKELDLSRYDALIFGGWFFAGSVKGLKELREKLRAFKGRKAVFVTGSMPPEAPEAAQALNAVFTEEEHKNTGIFYLRGGLNLSRMGFVHKMMMKMMSKMMKKQKGADSPEYKAVSQSYDATDKASIQPLIHYILQ